MPASARSSHASSPSRRAADPRRRHRGRPNDPAAAPPSDGVRRRRLPPGDGGARARAPPRRSGRAGRRTGAAARSPTGASTRCSSASTASTGSPTRTARRCTAPRCECSTRAVPTSSRRTTSATVRRVCRRGIRCRWDVHNGPRALLACALRLPRRARSYRRLAPLRRARRGVGRARRLGLRLQRPVAPRERRRGRSRDRPRRLCDRSSRSSTSDGRAARPRRRQLGLALAVRARSRAGHRARIGAADALQRAARTHEIRPGRGPLRVDALPALRAQRAEAARDLARPLAELRRRPAARAQPRDPAPRLRPRHHPLRPRQQLRPALRQRREELRPHPRRGLRRPARRARDLHEGRLRHVARALRRVGLAQVPAREPRAEPRPDGPRLRRHLLLAPLRPGHAAAGDDGRARRGAPSRSGALRRHLLLRPGAHAPRRPRSCASWAPRC